MIQTLEMQPPQMAGIAAIDLYFNPVSSYANRVAARHELRRLTRLFQLSDADAQLIDERPTPELIAERHRGRRAPNLLSVSEAGDGGALEFVNACHDFIQLQLDSDTDDTEPLAIPLMGFSGSGNGLNLHSSLHGKLHARSLSGLLESGEAAVGLLHAMEYTFADGHVRRSQSIFGMGVTAHIAKHLEAQREQLRGLWRPLRLGVESVSAAASCADYDTEFDIESPELGALLQSGTKAGVDWINVPTIVKAGRVPVRALGHDMFAMQSTLPETRHGRVVSAVIGGVRLAMGVPNGAVFDIAPGEKVTLRVTKANKPVKTTLDGEEGPDLHEGDEVQAGRSVIGLPVICGQYALAG
ncbi:hypothetical protein EYC58_00295 [Candidatus Saccharibacteria bacterium]|nr:MAG: hypothetical protein EYC58_00295 [Candidatus Saccharibacteria bacterium]